MYPQLREWMRICFELLDLLKLTRKPSAEALSIPLTTLSRASDPRMCWPHCSITLRCRKGRTGSAQQLPYIAIVAEMCSPFTVFPMLMNEYCLPELNVQNGVLKSLSFMFEYIGEMGKDYVFAVSPLLEDTLMDRDLYSWYTTKWHAGRSNTWPWVCMGLAKHFLIKDPS